VSRAPARRLEDILLACDAIDAHLRRGPAGDPFADGLVFDAVRVRLIEIGEAAKDLPAERSKAHQHLVAPERAQVLGRAAGGAAARAALLYARRTPQARTNTCHR